MYSKLIKKINNEIKITVEIRKDDINKKYIYYIRLMVILLLIKNMKNIIMIF